MQNRIRRKTDGVSIAVCLTGNESLVFNYMLVLMALVMLVQLCVGDSGSPLADSSAYFVCVSSEGYRMGSSNDSSRLSSGTAPKRRVRR